MKKLAQNSILVFIVFVFDFILVFSQASKGEPVYTIPCSIYDSPILLNEKLKIINLGPGVNSPDIDYAPTISLDGRTLYFVSNRKGSKIHVGKYGSNNESAFINYEFIVVKKKQRYDTIPSNLYNKKKLGIYNNSKTFNLMSIDSMWVIKDTLITKKYKIPIINDELITNTHDFWYITKTERLDTFFSKPKNLDTSTNRGEFGLNTNLNEGAGSISADGKFMYFTACNRLNGIGNCDIFVSEFKNGEWVNPIPLNSKVNSKNFDSQPSISPYNKRIYFTSTRKGPNSNGKEEIYNFDIWYSDWDESTNDWGEAKNLSQINTNGCESAPFIASDGVTLFFSSDSLKPNFGGKDFYVTKYNPATDQWSKPVNLGKPLNTAQDDMFICIPASGDVLYFSSSRKDIPNAQGDLDIYMAYVPEYLSEDICSSDSKFSLVNYPNPFAKITKIEYNLPYESYVSISILNVMGETVKNLAAGNSPAGVNTLEWDATDNNGIQLVSGLYLIKFEFKSDDRVKQIYKKIMLMK